MTTLISLIFFLCSVAYSHILMPPFLSNAYINNYFEQKIRISKLNNAQFKISGLPSGIYWTINGTIFGTPSTSGEYKINIHYESLTESGTYQTSIKIKNSISQKMPQNTNTDSVDSFDVIFPQNLIFLNGKKQQIQLKSKNGKQPIKWNFVTLPTGVKPLKEGKLQVNISKEGLYIVRFQAIDSGHKELQGCLTLNVQKNIENFTESYAYNTIYQSNNISKLVEFTNKESQITKKLFETSKQLGESSALINQTQNSFKRIENNLIQLQNEARIVSSKLQNSLRDKGLQEQNLKQATKILQSAQSNLNLVLIEQSSNNDLLNDSSIQKQKAQNVYNKAANQLGDQLKLVNALQKSILQKQQAKQTLTQTLNQDKSSYNTIGQQVLVKQKQIASSNEAFLKIQQQAHASQLQMKLQQQVLNQQQTQYSIMSKNINQSQNRSKQIGKQMEDLRRQRELISSDMIKFDDQLNSIKQDQLLKLQTQIKDINMQYQDLLLKTIGQFEQNSYKSTFIEEQTKNNKFQGCSNGQYPTLQGIFKISEGSILDQYYKTQNGQQILFGNCTKMPNLKPEDQIIFLGYTAHGALHANIIAPY